MLEASQIEELKRYIFHEMTEKEGEVLEERFFEDSDYFYEFLTLENDLIDSYAIGNISGNDLKRFERSLAKSPERYEKIANARALQKLIDEENSVSIPIPALGLRERISDFFNFRSSVFQFAAGTLAILVICAAGFLVYKTRQKPNDFAERETRREAERIEQENRRKQLEEEQKRLEKKQNEENQKQLENINSNTQDANNQPQEKEKRKNRIEEIKRKIESLPDRKDKPSPNSNEIIPSKELLAVAIISTGKGGTGFEPKGELVGKGAKQKVRVTQILSADKDYDAFEIVSNGEKIDGGNIPEKAKSFVFFLKTDVQNFEIKVNERGGSDGSAKSLGTYKLKLTKNK